MIEFSEMRKKTACFTGHRQIGASSPDIVERIAKTAEGFIKQGYKYFGAGGARGFDALASETILKLQITYPQIHLILVLPFDEQYRHENDWTLAEVEQYHRLKERASKVVMLAPEYSPGVYYRRNRHLIDNSSVCIAYMTKANSGTGYTVNYAKTKGIQVVNIALSEL